MPNVHTLNSLNKNQSEKDGSDDEGRQGFYVGGSDQSGQQVLGPAGPNKGQSQGRDIAEQVFEAAKRAGAEVLNPEESARHHEQLQGPSTTTGVTLSGRESSTVRVNVIFWEDGFSIDDGPLRSVDSNESRQFIQELQSGRIPTELQEKYPGKHCDVHMVRRPEPYKKPPLVPFRGKAQRLGGLSPEIVSSSNVDTDLIKVNMGSNDPAKCLEEAQRGVCLDSSKPKGKIQIRQPNGQRIIGEFNSTHTVNDVRVFVVRALPEFLIQPFALHTTFPSKPIVDEQQTVVEANILNAVVLIKCVK